MLEALRNAVHGDDQRGTGEPRAGRRAEPDRSLREDDDRVSDPHVAALHRGEARRHDVRTQDDVLVLEVVGDLREVRLRVGDEDVLGLAAIDRVAEAPPADGLEAVSSMTALSAISRETRSALAARRYGTDDDAVAFRESAHARADLLHDAYGLVADHLARLHRVLTL